MQYVFTSSACDDPGMPAGACDATGLTGFGDWVCALVVAHTRTNTAVGASRRLTAESIRARPGIEMRLTYFM